MYFNRNVLFIFGIPLWIAIRIIINIIKSKKEKSIAIKREFGLAILFIYIICVLGVTFFPLFISRDIDKGNISVNILPLYNTVMDIINDCSNYSFMIYFWIKNILGNMMLLFPLALLIPLLWDKFKSIKKVTVFCMFISLGIEVLQLLTAFIGNRGRAFDVDDIILNTLGAYIGGILSINVLQLYKQRRIDCMIKRI